MKIFCQGSFCEKMAEYFSVSYETNYYETATFPVCLWAGKIGLHSRLENLLNFRPQSSGYDIICCCFNKKKKLFCMSVFLWQSQCDGQCGNPGRPDRDRVCSFLQAGETSAPGKHGATWWGEINQLTLLMTKRDYGCLPTPVQYNVMRLREVC